MSTARILPNRDESDTTNKRRIKALHLPIAPQVECSTTGAEEKEKKMAAFKFNCPQCGAQYEVDRKDLNRSITCGTCGNKFVVGASNTLREDAASAFRDCGTIPEWRYFVAWLAYSAAALLAVAVFCGLLGASLGASGVGLDTIGGMCFGVGMFVSMPIGYFTFRYVAITIINGIK